MRLLLAALVALLVLAGPAAAATDLRPGGPPRTVLEPDSAGITYELRSRAPDGTSWSWVVLERRGTYRMRLRQRDRRGRVVRDVDYGVPPTRDFERATGFETSIGVAPDGSFWTSDELGLRKWSATGALRRSWSPGPEVPRTEEGVPLAGRVQVDARGRLVTEVEGPHGGQLVRLDRDGRLLGVLGDLRRVEVEQLAVSRRGAVALLVSRSGVYRDRLLTFDAAGRAVATRSAPTPMRTHGLTFAGEQLVLQVSDARGRALVASDLRGRAAGRLVRVPYSTVFDAGNDGRVHTERVVPRENDTKRVFSTYRVVSR